MRNTWHRSILLATVFAAAGCSSDSQTPNPPASAGGSSSSSKTSSTSASGGSTGQTGGSSATSTTKTNANGGSTSSSNNNSSAVGGSSSPSNSSSNGGSSTSSASKQSSGGAPTSNSGKTGGSGPAAGGAGTKTSTPAAAGRSSGGGNGPSNAGGPALGGAPSDGGAPMAGSAPVGVGGTGGVPSGIAVNLDKTRQTIQGFGINTALSDKNIPISTMFSTSGADGIGLSILRVGMNTDGTLTGTGIADARKADPKAKIIGSCWSAPAKCKSNTSTKDGGYLLDTGTCMADWATAIANFAKAQDLYAMSIANESDFASCPGNPVCTDSYETMTYTAKQMVAWVKVAGKKIKEVSPKTLVIAPEASEWIHIWSNLSGTGSIVSSHPDSSDPHKCGCFSNTITAEKEATCAKTCLDGNGYDYGHWLWKDQEAWKAFDILGLHEYDSQIAFPWPADVNDGKRDKEVWQTEMSGVMHWPEQGPSTDIANGIAVGGWIHSALTVGEASAWLYWWYQALYQDDNEGLALTKSGSTIAKRYYVLGNYSKFVRPGYLAVELTGNGNKDVLLSSYKSEDGKTVVIVAINKGSAKADVPIGFSGGTAPASCTPTVTSATDNLKDGTAVTVTGGTLTASLAAQTITTFVCK